MIYKVVRGNSFSLHVFVRQLKVVGSMFQLADYDLTNATSISVVLIDSLSQCVRIGAEVNADNPCDIVCQVPSTLGIGCYDVHVSWMMDGERCFVVERNIIGIVLSGSQSRIPLGIMEGERSGIFDLRFQFGNEASEKTETSVSLAQKIDITDSTVPLDLNLSESLSDEEKEKVFDAVREGIYVIVDNSNRTEGISKDVVTGILHVFKDYGNAMLTEYLTSNYETGSFSDPSKAQVLIQYRMWQNGTWSQWTPYSNTIAISDVRKVFSNKNIESLF